MSIAVRRSLAKQLKQFREASGKSVADVVSTRIVAKSTLGAIENAERPIKVSHVMSLCSFYNIDSETTARLVGMTGTTEKGWWEGRSEGAGSRDGFFSQLESEADRVCTYDAELLYGLLQTPAYHRAVQAADPSRPDGSGERDVDLQRERQLATLGRTPPLAVTTVVNEAVLLREVGGRAVAAELKEHLRQLNTRPNIDLSVLPLDAGPHAAMRGPFRIIGFDEPDTPDVVYLETYEGVRYLEDEERIRTYRERFADLRRRAVDLADFLR